MAYRLTLWDKENLNSQVKKLLWRLQWMPVATFTTKEARTEFLAEVDKELLDNWTWFVSDKERSRHLNLATEYKFVFEMGDGSSFGLKIEPSECNRYRGSYNPALCVPIGLPPRVVTVGEEFTPCLHKLVTFAQQRAKNAADMRFARNFITSRIAMATSPGQIKRMMPDIVAYFDGRLIEAVNSAQRKSRYPSKYVPDYDGYDKAMTTLALAHALPAENQDGDNDYTVTYYEK